MYLEKNHLVVIGDFMLIKNPSSSEGVYSILYGLYCNFSCKDFLVVDFIVNCPSLMRAMLILFLFCFRIDDLLVSGMYKLTIMF